MTELSSVQQWSYPFNLKGEEGQSSTPVTDPLQYFDALAKAKGGYYPIGKNGLWHGGVHFDSGTAASLDQSAIRCIADGEVVAYRIDDTYKKSNFSSGEKLFSTGFVLVRHKLELPKLNEQANATNTPTEQPSLIFYSLYMHLLDWAGYTKENAPTPPNFLNKAVYSVKADKATDVVKGLRVRTAPRNGQIKAVLPKGTRVKLGEQSATNNKWYRLISILEGQALPAINLDEECWVFEGQLDHTDVSDERLVGVKANDTELTLAPQKGLNIRKAATGADKKLLTGLIPVDVTFTLETDTGRYCKIKEFISGQNILPLKEDCIKNISGYVYKECLQASRIPPTLNDIHVLDSPHPIRAGEIIGHLGIYQNHDDIAAEPMLHLEVFSCEDVPAFIEKTKAAVASLPNEKKNLLKIHKGTSKLISHRSDISASNPPKLSDTGTVIGVDMIFNLEALNTYPQDRKITVTETSPRSTTSKTRTWWRLDNILADQQGNKISGWLTEQSELTTRHSPWEWEGFDFISETPCNLDHLACHFDNSGQLDESEQADYAARIDLSDNGPIKKRLYDIIDTNNDKRLSSEEIKAALALPWNAQSIYKIIACYESEWLWNSLKWNELDSLIISEEGDSNWIEEKNRIKTLSWFQSYNEKLIEDKYKIKEEKVWHINPIGLISNLIIRKKCTCNPKINVTKWKSKNTNKIYYGPVHWGTKRVAQAPQWEQLISSNVVTNSDKTIILIMTENEGKLDSVQSYDGEIITAGAMQKTIKLNGAGELADQVKKFKESHEELYVEYFETKGWHIDTSSNPTKLYYQNASWKDGSKLEGLELRNAIRENCSGSTYGQIINCLPVSTLVCAISSEEYINLQLADYVDRLNEALSKKPTGHTYTARDLFKTNLGRATVLDQCINRPSNVSDDLKSAIDKFYLNNPSINTEISSWGENHSEYENKILEIYGKNRRMTDANERYLKLKEKF